MTHLNAMVCKISRVIHIHPQIDLQFTPLKQEKLFTHNVFFAKLGCHQIGTLYNGKRFMVLLT
jgi:hypothetical protein